MLVMSGCPESLHFQNRNIVTMEISHELTGVPIWHWEDSSKQRIFNVAWQTLSREKKRHVLTPDKELTTDQSTYSTNVHHSTTMYFIRITYRGIVKGLWKKITWVTQWHLNQQSVPELAWHLTKSKNPRAYCTACRQLNSIECHFQTCNMFKRLLFQAV